MPGRTRNVALVLLLTLLGACTVTGTSAPVPATWTDHRARLAALSAWEARGKLALRSPTGSENASIVWRQSGVDTEVRMSGPLGVAPTLLRSDGRVLTINRGGDRQLLDLNDPAAVRTATGWHFPVTALPHWLKGTPTLDLPLTDLAIDEVTGLARGFTQGDWAITYSTHGQFGTYS
ncbi:MAG: outer membrane lipoprotein LolB, partial [Halioglobus sp.]|nr:outer membrane lipoprotein LolB [Halioglobus sp.]